MITYERYAEIRDKKNLTDGKVAELAGFGRSTFSDWKSGRSIPKIDKMQKIAEVLEMDYIEFVGPIGKYSSLNPNKPEDAAASYIVEIPGTKEKIEIIGENTKEVERISDFIHSYLNSDSDTQTAIQLLVKSHRSDP